MTARTFYVADSGAYLGCVPLDFAIAPDGGIEVPSAPPIASATWDADYGWIAPAADTARVYVDDAGNYLGSFDAANAPAGGTAVAAVPERASDRWNGAAWAPDLTAAIERRCKEVDALRDTKFAAGMPYGEKVLQLGEIDQQRIIAAGASAKFALLNSTAWPADFGWIMADNTLLPLDAAGMSTMADVAAAKVQAWIFNGYAHKQALRALTDVAAIEAYDISSGW
jgi:hypothetical protein